MSNKINLPLEGLKDNNVFDQTFTYLLDVKKAFGKKIIFHDNDCGDLRPIVSLSTSPIPLNVEPFEPVEDSCDVAGVDSSCITIGETEEGAIYSVKSAVSIFNSSRPKAYHIYGPYVVYVDEQAIRQVYRDNPLREKIVKLVILEHDYAKNLVRTIVEREIFRYLSDTMENGIILCDGSLKSSAFEVEGCKLKEILKRSNEKGNTLIGVSKSSRLKFIRKVSNHLELLNYAPVKVDVHLVVDHLLAKLEGHIFVVKFKKHGYAFRVDIPYDSVLDVDVSLGKVLFNDGFRHGYPESLMMAHNISVFNELEQVSVKSALTRSFNMKQVPATRLRKVLLGGLRLEGGSGGL
ncbi:MAG: DNA double-strand break repair nuclease NurA [Nitrososphaeria archaeon]